jgi:methyl-accepting chemotaxis protein
METKARYKRRQYFIDKNFQTWFILKFCTIVITSSFLTAILIYVLNRNTTTVAFENLKVVVKSTADFILPVLLQTIIVVAILVSIAAILVTTYISHKIAGPLYSLKRSMKKTEEGDLSFDFNIRKNDQFQGIDDEFNSMIKTLKQSLAVLKDNWPGLKAKILESSSAKDFQEESEIKERVERIDKELQRFKTE